MDRGREGEKEGGRVREGQREGGRERRKEGEGERGGGRDGGTERGGKEGRRSWRRRVRYVYTCIYMFVKEK